MNKMVVMTQANWPGNMVETEASAVAEVLRCEGTYPSHDAIIRLQNGRVLFWGAWYQYWAEKAPSWHPYYTEDAAAAIAPTSRNWVNRDGSLAEDC